VAKDISSAIKAYWPLFTLTVLNYWINTLPRIALFLALFVPVSHSLRQNHELVFINTTDRHCCAWIIANWSECRHQHIIQPEKSIHGFLTKKKDSVLILLTVLGFLCKPKKAAKQLGKNQRCNLSRKHYFLENH
jgi:hypothetical protein